MVRVKSVGRDGAESTSRGRVRVERVRRLLNILCLLLKKVRSNKFEVVWLLCDDVVPRVTDMETTVNKRK